jgi:valyl-tRNA synthetase
MLGGTVMDILVRHHRMKGEPTLWLPGIDHAGLATQVEVRKHLARQHVQIESLSREAVVERVREWKEDHEKRIGEQWTAAGFSLDLSRYRYTMDPGFVRATRRAFVTLYTEGLIYRGERIVNWDPKLETAISDLEVEHREEPGTLLYVRYAWADGQPGGLVVATVRPETIFGDVAVAVHPEDPRHAGLAGKSVRVPLTDRVVPIITDAQIDPKFGNGALKVTPRHDALDYDVFRRHSELSMPPTILDPSGRLSGDWVPERFRGLDREVARREVTAALRSAGLLEREEPYTHSVGRSERSDAAVEPYLSTQWFVRMAPLRDAAVEAVRSGAIRLHPDRWKLSFDRWMENLQDWCISRQIAWGHPIPVFRCDQGHQFAAEEAPTSCVRCGSTVLTADPDVLDTWFSSWLWPFAALGWPEPTGDLASYFPTNVLVTGRDIMFFWVARMMMASCRFMDRAPFSDVYFTGMVRDPEGRRLSKHLGNSPDPLDLIRSHGADALRFGLIFPNPTDQDGPFGQSTLDSARNFLTKVWNLGRLVLQHTPPGTPAVSSVPTLDPEAPVEDRWVLSRWRHTSEAVDQALLGFEFTRVADALYQFLWHDLADWYVEVSRPALSGARGEPATRRTRAILLYVLDRALRTLHPLVPHVTEELWSALPHDQESLEKARWPSPDEAPSDPGAEVAMEVFIEGVRSVRHLKETGGIPASERPVVWCRPANAEVRGILQAMSSSFQALAQVSELRLLAGAEPDPPGHVTAVELHGQFFLQPPAAGPADAGALLLERRKLEQLREKNRRRLADAGFRAHAPSEVQRETEEKLHELEERIRKIDAALSGPTPGAG